MKIQTIGDVGVEGTYSIACSNKSFCSPIVFIFRAFTFSFLPSRLSWKSLKQKVPMYEYMLSSFQTFIYDRCKYTVNDWKT